MLEDVMIATIGASQRTVLSDITLAYFDDMDYFTPNYAAAEPTRWGLNAGCGFFNDACDTPSGGRDDYFHFPEVQTLVCTFDHISSGTVSVQTYTKDLPPWGQFYANPRLGGNLASDYCPMTISHAVHCTSTTAESDSITSNVYGARSRCFESTEAVIKKPYEFESGGLLPRCVVTRCVGGTRLQFQVGELPTWIACPADGSRAIVDLDPYGFQGKLTCPPASTICHDTSLCVPDPQRPSDPNPCTADDTSGGDGDSDGGNTGGDSSTGSGVDREKEEGDDDGSIINDAYSSQLSPLEVTLIVGGCGILAVFVTAVFICHYCKLKKSKNVVANPIS